MRGILVVILCLLPAVCFAQTFAIPPFVVPAPVVVIPAPVVVPQVVVPVVPAPVVVTPVYPVRVMRLYRTPFRTWAYGKYRTFWYPLVPVQVVSP
jgi:hypothetical protein